MICSTGTCLMRIALRFKACVAIVLLTSCTSAPLHETPLIVAHRGASHLAPENTLASFNLAWQRGADLIEGDFYLSSDGIIITHHDNTTKRTAGVDIAIHDQTLAELKRLDAGSWKDPKWAGETIPTLDEVLKTIPDQCGILIEIKTDASIIPFLVEVLAASDIRSQQTIVICFDELVIECVKERLPAIKAFWLSSFDNNEAGIWKPTLAEIIETAKRIKADGVALKANLEVIDESFVAKIHKAGLELYIWTVNDATIAKRLSDLGVEGIITDRPGWLRTELSLKGY